MLPMELRPARFGNASTSGAYPEPLCSSGFTTFTIERRPADVGFVLMRAMSGHSFHKVDVALALQAHISLFHGAPAADEAPMALLLALDVYHIDGCHLHLLLLEEEFHRGLDLSLGRVAQNLEHHLPVGLAHERGLFRDHRGHDHL